MNTTLLQIYLKCIWPKRQECERKHSQLSLKCSRVRIEMNYEKFKRSDRPDRFRSLTLLSTIFSSLKQVMSLFTLGSARAVLVVALVYFFWMSLMWSWHWSPLTQTSLLLSSSDGLASFLKTTLANGVKVVKKVVAQTFCDILFMKKRHQISIYKQFRLTVFYQ
jgi:hypothetical protein